MRDFEIHNLEDVLSKLTDLDNRVLLLSNTTKFKDFDCVYVHNNTNIDFFSGSELSAVFVDVDIVDKFDLTFIYYLLNKVRGKGCDKFPERLYFVSNFKDEGQFNFFGKINL